MIVGARLNISITADLLGFSLTVYSEQCNKEKHPVYAFLIRKLNREWPDWFNLTERL